MSYPKKKKSRKKRIEAIVTAFLAVALAMSTAVAIWASYNPDAHISELFESIINASARQYEHDVVASVQSPPFVYDDGEYGADALEDADMDDGADAPDGAGDAESANVPAGEASATESQTVEIVISCVGDITMGREVLSGQNRFENAADRKGLDYFFSGVREILEQDDLTIGNLEGPLTTAKTHRKGRQFIFKGKPEYAQVLSLGSVEAVTIANNHSRDFLGRGQKDTQNALNEHGITWFGYGKTAIYEVKGVKIGLIGLTEWDNSAAQLRQAVKKINESCDMVIVQFHWGREGKGQPTKKQKRLGHAAIDAGADAVFGHHPHVVGGIEIYNGRTIAYSLGNFCFAGNTNPADKDTVIIRQSFTVDAAAGDVVPGSLAVIPCSISSSSDTNDFRPQALTGNRAAAVFEKIKKASRGFAQTPDFDGMAAG
ncbi:MAG: CapA family protein [Clostridia bacterium]|nr:CapA family protein [Clostridia bacterium]